MEEIILDFIEWARDCGQDAFYIFDDTEDALRAYMEHLENQK